MSLGFVPSARPRTHLGRQRRPHRLALILVFRLTPQRVVGTDVFQAAILLWVAGLTHMFFGNVDYTLMANILIGSLPGVWLGTHLVTRVPDRRAAHHPRRRPLRLRLRRHAEGRG